jgi:hypothetical protein
MSDDLGPLPLPTIQHDHPIDGMAHVGVVIEIRTPTFYVYLHEVKNVLADMGVSLIPQGKSSSYYLSLLFLYVMRDLGWPGNARMKASTQLEKTGAVTMSLKTDDFTAFTERVERACAQYKKPFLQITIQRWIYRMDDFIIPLHREIASATGIPSKYLT